MTQDFDEDRHLCPDGTCIGVLDADGRCKVCGRLGVKADVPYRDAFYDQDDGGDVGGETPEAEADHDAADDDDRRLCPDGSCIGLLGDDGRCKVCGKSAS